MVDLANNEKIVAIGETGLDYFHCKGDVTWQQDRFRRHIQAAITCNKPLIIHTRNAREDTIAIMKEQVIEVKIDIDDLIENYKQELDLIVSAIQNDDGDQLLELFGKSKAERDSLVGNC